MTHNNEYALKILIMGDDESGKSSLIRRIVNDKFSIKNKLYAETTKIITQGEINFKLNFVEIQEKEKFQTADKSIYNDCSAIIITFDLTSIESFRSVPFWIKQIKSIANFDFIILVGTKSDLTTEERIDDKTIINLCKNFEDYNIKYIETSSKTKKNINGLADLIINTSLIYKTNKKSETNMQKKTYSTFENMSETINLIPHEKPSKVKAILKRWFGCWDFF